MKEALMNPLTSTIIFIALVILIILYTRTFIKKFLDKSVPFKTKIAQNLTRIMMFFFMILMMITMGKRVYQYFTFDMHFPKAETRYTVANLDYVWKDFRGKFYTIPYYTAQFSFTIDGRTLDVKSDVPENFTNYSYFIKINIKYPKYYQILKANYALPSNFQIPAGGWSENPITIISNNFFMK